MELQRHSKVPLYQQLKNALRLRIETGEWRSGERIPSEPELSEKLGIARGTVRSAITELVNEGLLERRHGEGTHVTHRSLEQKLLGFYSFAREAQAQGLELSSQVLEWSTAPATDGLRQRLELPEDARVLQVSRLRLLQGEPILLETCYLPATLCASLREEDFVQGALYDALEARCRLKISRAEETFTAVVLGEYEAGILHAAAGAPALSVERVAHTAGNRPVELRLGILRGDRCRYHIELH